MELERDRGTMSEFHPSDGHGDAPRSLRQAAVLLVLYGREGEPHALFTRRTDLVADHKGQICLPGGSRDESDLSLAETALREAHEELGIDPSAVRIVAGLAPVLTVVTRYVITPFVGYTPSRPATRADSFEVAEVIDAPLSALMDPAIRRVEVWDSHGVTREVYFYQYGPHLIWGATARILKQFLDGYTTEWWQAVIRGDVVYRPSSDSPPLPV